MKTKMVTKVKMSELKIGDTVHFHCGGKRVMKEPWEVTCFKQAYYDNGEHKPYILKDEPNAGTWTSPETKIISIEVEDKDSFAKIREDVLNDSTMHNSVTRPYMKRILDLLV